MASSWLIISAFVLKDERGLVGDGGWEVGGQRGKEERKAFSRGERAL